MRKLRPAELHGLSEGTVSDCVESGSVLGLRHSEADVLTTACWFVSPKERNRWSAGRAARRFSLSESQCAPKCLLLNRNDVSYGGEQRRRPGDDGVEMWEEGRLRGPGGGRSGLQDAEV